MINHSLKVIYGTAIVGFYGVKAKKESISEVFLARAN